MKIQINRLSGSVNGKIQIGGSKSISNRLIILRGLANSSLPINNLSTSDDTNKLLQLEDGISSCEKGTIPMVLDIKNAGTLARFLTAYLAAREGTWLITGQGRMMERPMDGIVDCLRQVGANIEYLDRKGFLPIKILGSDIQGNSVTIDASKSSQFLSAIMMIGPYFENGLRIHLEKKPVSLPYVEMTQKLMQSFGAHVEITSDEVKIQRGKYEFHTTTVEPDWSSASYFYELVALSESAELLLEGLSINSIQGDRRVADIFELLGVETKYEKEGIRLRKKDSYVKEFSYDFIGNPDIVPSVITTCAALGIKSEFKNISHLKYKESDRIEALTTELLKIGAKLTYKGKTLKMELDGSAQNTLIFNTYDDHRMAMAFAPLAMKFNSITIDNTDVVNKSYPEFWDDLKKTNFANFNFIN